MFVPMEEAQYRAMDSGALESRKAEILALADDPNCDVDDSVIESEARMCEAEITRRNKMASLRSANMASALSGGGSVMARADNTVQRRRERVDEADTDEYREAFMEYLRTGSREGLMTRDRNGMLTRTPQHTTTSDIPVAIPTTLSTSIIEELDQYGDIYAMVSKTSFQGGYEIPIDSFDFTTSWVTEDQVTDTQKAARSQKISFSYYEFESRVQWSWLSDIVSFANFTSKFQPKMSKSIVKLLEQGIIRGTGSGQMKGIVGDTRITNVVEMTEAQFKDWKNWHSMVDAVIKPEYDDGSIIMAKSTWNKYIDTMADDVNAPVNYLYDPVSGKRTNTLIGKDVHLVKNVILPDFDTASAGDVVAIYGDLSNYAVNWQPGGGISILRYPDYDHRRHNLLGYGVCDGKVVDPYGFVLIKKKASA